MSILLTRLLQYINLQYSRTLIEKFLWLTTIQRMYRIYTQSTQRNYTSFLQRSITSIFKCNHVESIGALDFIVIIRFRFLCLNMYMCVTSFIFISKPTSGCQNYRLIYMAVIRGGNYYYWIQLYIYLVIIILRMLTCLR